jgi:hypothetical protein
MQWRFTSTAIRNGILRRLKKVPLISDNLDLVRFLQPAADGLLKNLNLEEMNRIFEQTSPILIQDSPRSEAMAELVARIPISGRIRHARTGEYFRWRFRNPLSRYRFLYWGEERLDGYLVLQEYTSQFANKEVLNIVDWEASSATVGEALLQAALRIAQGRRLLIWSATLPSSTIGLLKQHGFRSAPPPKLPTPPAVLVRSLKTNQPISEWAFAGRSLLRLENWDLRMLYSMHG